MFLLANLMPYFISQNSEKQTYYFHKIPIEFENNFTKFPKTNRRVLSRVFIYEISAM